MDEMHRGFEVDGFRVHVLRRYARRMVGGREERKEKK